MNRLLSLLWVLVAAASLAADYQIKTVKVLPLESYPARLTIEGITIAADPYETDEKSLTAFDIKNLNSRGYFPVHVIIQNSSTEYVTLRVRSVVLATNSGQELYTTSATMVVQDVVPAGFVSKLPKMKSHDQSTSTKTGSPLLDFTGKELTNRQIEPGAVSAGFLFFYSPGSKKSFFAGSRLVIPQLINDGTRKVIGPFSISMDAALSSATTP